MSEELKAINDYVDDMVNKKIRNKYDSDEFNYIIQVNCVSHSFDASLLDDAHKILSTLRSVVTSDLYNAEFMAIIIITQSELAYAELKNRMCVKKEVVSFRYDDIDFLTKLENLLIDRMSSYASSYGKADFPKININ